MTLQDAYAIYVAKTHFRTLRRYLAWRVLNAANSNTRAPTVLPSLSRAETEGAGINPLAPSICPINAHASAHTEFPV